MIMHTSSSHTIKELPEPDLPQVLNVYRQCEDFLALGPVPCASMGMVKNDFHHSREEGGIFYGIFNDSGSMIGIVDVVLAGLKGNPEHAFISLLMIALPYRNQGIGHKIVTDIEERIKTNTKVKVIFSAVQTNNLRAIEFWKKLGYQINGGPHKQMDKTIIYNLRKDVSPV